jgi:hypothetical protein
MPGSKTKPEVVLKDIARAIRKLLFMTEADDWSPSRDFAEVLIALRDTYLSFHALSHDDEGGEEF